MPGAEEAERKRRVPGEQAREAQAASGLQGGGVRGAASRCPLLRIASLLPAE